MENDPVFAADANIDPLPGSQDRHDRSAHRGYDTVNKISGAIEAPDGRDYEDTPLLSRNIDDDYERHPEPTGREQENHDPQWSGAKDFEGRPWWTRPSVSLGSSLKSLRGLS